jgi:hypothetical protein
MTQLKTSIKQMNGNETSCRIICEGNLTGTEASKIRTEISNCITNAYSIVYLDTKAVTNADLSGINEVIHTAYCLGNTDTRFTLIYKVGSTIEKWVQITGLDRFVQTAIVPEA